MQAVEQGGRFDVGARLPQPLRAREEQRLLLPQRQQPQRRREQHQRRDYDRRQHGPFEVCRMQFHLFVAAFYAVDRPFAFEIERVAVGAVRRNPAACRAGSVRTVCRRSSGCGAPARRPSPSPGARAAPARGVSVWLFRQAAGGARRTVRQVSERPRLSGRGRDSPAASLGDDLRCRRSVGRGSDIRRGGSCRREDPPRHDAPDSHDGCEQQTGRPSAISRFGGFGIVRLLRLLGHGFLGDREPQCRGGGLVTGVEGRDRPFVTARFEP